VSVKHLKKADGSKAELEEKLPFMVLEFNAEARRIVLSHTRTFEEGDEPVAAAPAKRGAPRKEAAGAAGGAVKAVNDKVEKSTLGDLSVLSDLKSQMENKERATKGGKDQASE
jgi:small subunit ribosomal protein S1